MGRVGGNYSLRLWHCCQIVKKKKPETDRSEEVLTLLIENQRILTKNYLYKISVEKTYPIYYCGTIGHIETRFNNIALG